MARFEDNVLRTIKQLDVRIPGVWWIDVAAIARKLDVPDDNALQTAIRKVWQRNEIEVDAAEDVRRVTMVRGWR